MAKDIVAYEEKMKALARGYKEAEKLSGNFITLRNGILRYGEEEIPGNQMVCIVLDAVHENNYYPSKFDANLIIPPTCYAFGRDERDMAPTDMPDDDWFEPQAEACHKCTWNEWGTSDTGRGKACQQRRRLAVMLAGEVKRDGRRMVPEVFEYVEDFESAETAMLKLPVTSIKNWSKYVHFISKQYEKPPLGVVTLIYVEPDPNTQFKVCFDVLEEVSEELYGMLFQRRDEAMDLLTQGFQAPDEDVKKFGAVRGGKSIRNTRRRRHAEEDA